MSPDRPTTAPRDRSTGAVESAGTGSPHERRAVRRRRTALVVVFLIATAAAALGIGVRSTYAGYAAVDEPQYLLTAISLAEDGDLDIADELAEVRWLAFHAEGGLPVQTEVLADGRQLSPHDPLLPLLLAPAMALGGPQGGAVAAKAVLSLLAGAVAALTLWLAVVRLRLPLRRSAVGVAIAAASAPLAVYGQQVYPELPAALAVLVAVAGLTGPLGRRGGTALVLAVVALPWLSVKYVPVAAALALCGLVFLIRRRRLAAAGVLTAALTAAGAAYLLAHRLLYGGWTVYAAGDHFQDSGEFGVIGFRPDYAGRSIRLLGLLIDRDFGLAAWQPAWLLLVPALAVLLVRRPGHWAVLAVPLAVGWLTATYIALTMHGFWWPGRQLVVVLPLAVLVILSWVTRLPVLARGLATAAGAVGVLLYAVLIAAGLTGATNWVHAPDDLVLHVPLVWLFPDNRALAGTDIVLYALWTVLLALATFAAGSAAVMRPIAPPWSKIHNTNPVTRR